MVAGSGVMTTSGGACFLVGFLRSRLRGGMPRARRFSLVKPSFPLELRGDPAAQVVALLLGLLPLPASSAPTQKKLWK